MTSTRSVIFVAFLAAPLVANADPQFAIQIDRLSGIPTIAQHVGSTVIFDPAGAVGASTTGTQPIGLPPDAFNITMIVSGSGNIDEFVWNFDRNQTISITIKDNTEPGTAQPMGTDPVSWIGSTSFGSSSNQNIRFLEVSLAGDIGTPNNEFLDALTFTNAGLIQSTRGMLRRRIDIRPSNGITVSADLRSAKPTELFVISEGQDISVFSVNSSGGDSHIQFNMRGGGSIGSITAFNGPVEIRTSVPLGSINQIVVGTDSRGDPANDLPASLNNPRISAAGDIGSITAPQVKSFSQPTFVFGPERSKIESMNGSIGEIDIAGDLECDVIANQSINGPINVAGDYTTVFDPSSGSFQVPMISSQDLGLLSIFGGDFGGSLFAPSGLGLSSSVTVGGSLTSSANMDFGDGSPSSAGLAGRVVLNALDMGSTWSGPVSAHPASGNVTLLSGPSFGDTISSQPIGGGSVGLVPFAVWPADSVPAKDSSTPSIDSGIEVAFYGPVRFSPTAETTPGSGSPQDRPLAVTAQRVARDGTPFGPTLDLTNSLDFSITDERVVKIGPAPEFDIDRAAYSFEANPGPTPTLLHAGAAFAGRDVPVADDAASEYSFVLEPNCFSDLNSDNQVDYLDTIAFIDLFDAGSTEAEFAAPAGFTTASLDVADIASFLEAAEIDTGSLECAPPALATIEVVNAPVGDLPTPLPYGQTLPCDAIDVAYPYGVITAEDLDLWISYYIQGNLAADLVAPFGVVDEMDLAAFDATSTSCGF